VNSEKLMVNGGIGTAHPLKTYRNEFPQWLHAWKC